METEYERLCNLTHSRHYTVNEIKTLNSFEGEKARQCAGSTDYVEMVNLSKIAGKSS